MQNILVIVAVLISALQLPAQTNAPLRLALVAESAEASAAADVLTAELSIRKNLQLLERNEIEKVYREQGLAAGNKDYLKLGQMLGADGLLLLKKDADAAGEFLRVQLVAVKPGVVLSSERFAWPVKNPGEWSAALTRHLQPLLPKLGVLPQDAVAVSVVNLRSAIQSSEARELERQLTLLAVERLRREPQLFVTERRRLNSLASEKELNGLDDSAFWDGSFLLDGTLDNAGYSPDKITVSARLIPPKGGQPVPIEVSGSRADLSEAINRLAVKILETLKPGATNAAWNEADEAEQFFAEAQWAMKWNLFPQAQTAAESAWALGKRTPDAARLVVRAYAETLPDHGMNIGELPVYQVPDPGEFAPLDRGLEFFLHNTAVLFAETNSVQSFRLGRQLLYPAFGQLESYYYAAEQRAGHADELQALREKIRRMLAVLDAHPPVITNRGINLWDDPRLLYPELKWEEGGMMFERPEDALGFYQDLLGAGAIHEKPPRIIGWNWPDRQRVPALLHHFINDACASTNALMRLEGLYYGLLLAPDDEAGSLHRAEEELESAMWDNREVIFQSANNAALVEFTRNALIKKLGGDTIYKAYEHEPFASFKHRLRKDFLAGNAATNLTVLEQLFPNTNVKMETPEQARELLPLMEALTQRVPTNRISYKLADMRRNAGNAMPTVEPLPALQATAVLEAKFVPWRVAQGRLFSDRIPHFSGMVWRAGRLWVCVRYGNKNRPDFGDNFPTTYLAVDLQRGVTQEISFPEKLGLPGGLFEVSSNALYVEAGGRLFEYAFRDQAWTEIPAPMEGTSGMVWLDGRLFVGRGDGLLAVEPESKKVTLLVSARRTPAANEIDPLWTARTKIFPQADGRLGVMAETDLLGFDPAVERWNIRPLPLKGTNMSFNMFAEYFSPAGAQRLLTGLLTRRYLLGFWNDGPVESLLMEETGIPVNASLSKKLEKLLPPLRWDWPKSFSMEQSQITADGKTLWALAPRQWEFGAAGKNSVEFSDARDATLFYFTPDARAPMAAAVRFPMDSLPNPPMMNGHLTDVLDSHNFGYMMIFQRFDQRVGNMAFWLRVPGGLVFGGPNYCGHWFIAGAALQELLAPLPPEQTTPSHP
jgi:curli biogenesis system outer membrane secretion channel CsgG